MSALVMVLMIVGGLVAVGGNIMLLIAAFRTSLLWGLGCLFFSPVAILFVALNWEEAKQGFLIGLAGVALVMFASFMAPSTRSVDDYDQTAEVEAYD